jgi:hypothetical protein
VRVRAPTELGFTLRFLILALLLIAVPLLVGLADGGPLRYLPPAAAAVIVTIAYVAWPREALLTFALFLLFHGTLAIWMGVSIRLVDELTVPLLFAVAGIPALRRWREWLWWPRDVSISVAIGLGIVSSLAAGVPLAVWVPALALLAKGIAIFYVAMWTGIRPWELRAAMRIVLVVGGVVLVLSFVELLDPLRFQQTLGIREFDRPRGTLPALKSLFYHPVLFGWFTAFVALYLSAHFTVTRRWWSLAAALAFSLGPFLSARRRAILALASGLVAGAVRATATTRSWTEAVRSWAVLAAGVAVIAVVFLPGLTGLYQLTLDRYLPTPATPVPTTGVPGPLEPRDPDSEGDPNPQVRVALYMGSIEVARDHFPLGGGLGRYASHMSRIEYSPLYERYGLDRVRGLRPRNPINVTDTFWPQILGELGVFGLIAYVGFMASLGWILWRAAARAAEPMLRVFLIGTLMVFVQALVESLASPMFHSPPRAFLVYLAVGMVAASWRTRAAHE